MLKQPRLKKIKKRFRRGLKVSMSKNKKLCFGSLGLLSLEAGLISAKVLDTLSQSLARSGKRGARIWFRCFPDHPVTSKPLEVRMGKGKGQIKSWSAKVRKGSIFLEVTGVNLNLLRKVLGSLRLKLPVKTKIIKS